MQYTTAGLQDLQCSHEHECNVLLRRVVSAIQPAECTIKSAAAAAAVGLHKARQEYDQQLRQPYAAAAATDVHWQLNTVPWV